MSLSPDCLLFFVGSSHKGFITDNFRLVEEGSLCIEATGVNLSLINPPAVLGMRFYDSRSQHSYKGTPYLKASRFFLLSCSKILVLFYQGDSPPLLTVSRSAFRSRRDFFRFLEGEVCASVFFFFFFTQNTILHLYRFLAGFPAVAFGYPLLFCSPGVRLVVDDASSDFLGSR